MYACKLEYMRNNLHCQPFKLRISANRLNITHSKADK